MSAQTSMGSTTATIGGHGEEQSSLLVASGRTPGMTGVGHLSVNSTATSHARLSRTGAVFRADLGSEGVLYEAETSHTRWPEPGSNSPRREGPKRTSEGKSWQVTKKATYTERELCGRHWSA